MSDPGFWEDSDLWLCHGPFYANFGGYSLQWRDRPKDPRWYDGQGQFGEEFGCKLGK